MEPKKLFLREEVEQPLWLPPRFSGFVQTYRFGEKHTRNLLVYHDDSDAYAALYLFTFYGRTTPVDLNKDTGEITANSIANIKAMMYKVPRREGYEEKTGTLCENKRMDAFYVPDINKTPDNESLMFLIDFAYLYFSIGSANGDYREEKTEKPDILVAKSRLILPGDPLFNIDLSK